MTLGQAQTAVKSPANSLRFKVRSPIDDKARELLLAEAGHQQLIAELETNVERLRAIAPVDRREGQARRLAFLEAPPEYRAIDAAQSLESIGSRHAGTDREACMDAVQAKLGVREMSSSMQQGECTMEDFKQGGGTMSGTMVCKGASGFGAPKMEMNGTYSADKVTMTLPGLVTDDKLPGGKASMEMTVTSVRTGDCR